MFVHIDAIQLRLLTSLGLLGKTTPQCGAEELVLNLLMIRIVVGNVVTRAHWKR
jgi:hypothetical protein